MVNGRIVSWPASFRAPVAPGSRETLNQLRDPLLFVSDRSFSQRKEVCVESAFIQKGSGRTVGNDGRSFESIVGKRGWGKSCAKLDTSEYQRDQQKREVDCSPETSRSSRNCGWRHCETTGLSNSDCSLPRCMSTKAGH